MDYIFNNNEYKKWCKSMNIGGPGQLKPDILSFNKYIKITQLK